jgi:hypothetical protein
MICPKCLEEIDELTAFSLEENRQSVRWSAAWGLDWSTSEPVESSCVKIDFVCPLCDETIFHSSNNEVYDYSRVTKFLRDGIYEPV